MKFSLEIITYLKFLIFILIISELNLFGWWSHIFPSIEFILVLKIKLINKANNSSLLFSLISKWFKISSSHFIISLLFDQDLSLFDCFNSLTIHLISLFAIVIFSANLKTIFLKPLSNLLLMTSILKRSSLALEPLLLPCCLFINHSSTYY